MKRWLMAALLGIAAGMDGPARGQEMRDPQYPRWFANYEAARAEARRSGRPMFLVFRCVP